MSFEIIIPALIAILIIVWIIGMVSVILAVYYSKKFSRLLQTKYPEISNKIISAFDREIPWMLRSAYRGIHPRKLLIMLRETKDLTEPKIIELRSKTKNTTIIFLSALVIFSIVIFALFFIALPSYYNTILFLSAFSIMIIIALLIIVITFHHRPA